MFATKSKAPEKDPAGNVHVGSRHTLRGDIIIPAWRWIPSTQPCPSHPYIPLMSPQLTPWGKLRSVPSSPSSLTIGDHNSGISLPTPLVGTSAQTDVSDLPRQVPTSAMVSRPSELPLSTSPDCVPCLSGRHRRPPRVLSPQFRGAYHVIRDS